MTIWNVAVVRKNGKRKYLGTVEERNEELARCAALSRFGCSEIEALVVDADQHILPDDDFEVWRA